MGITEELANFVVEATYDSLPDVVVTEAKHTLL